MDFIERIFGISPDGGSGSFEAMLLFLPFAAIAALCQCEEDATPRGNET